MIFQRADTSERIRTRSDLTERSRTLAAECERNQRQNMETIKIHVSVDKQVALLAGSTHYGVAEFAPSSDQLATLEPAERRAIAAYDGNLRGNRSITIDELIENGNSSIVIKWDRQLDLDSAEVTWEAIVAALRRDIAKVHGRQAEHEEALRANRERDEQIARENAAKAAAWLALPRDQQVARKYPADATDRSYVVAVDYSIRDREDIRARIVELQTYCEERQAADLAEIAKKRAPWIALCREYVIDHVPDFAPAAREGLDVSGQAGKALRTEIENSLRSVADVVDGYAERPQDLPRALAYDRLTKVRSALGAFVREPAAGFTDGGHPLISSIESGIVRVDLDPNRGAENWRTCICVDVKLGDGSDLESIYVCAEESCGAKDDEEDT